MILRIDGEVFNVNNTEKALNAYCSSCNKKTYVLYETSEGTCLYCGSKVKPTKKWGLHEREYIKCSRCKKTVFIPNTKEVEDKDFYMIIKCGCGREYEVSSFWHIDYLLMDLINDVKILKDEVSRLNGRETELTNIRSARFVYSGSSRPTYMSAYDR